MKCSTRFLQTFCILFAAYKFLYTLRYNKNFVHIIYMLTETFAQLRSFTAILLFGICVFAIIAVNNDINIEDSFIGSNILSTFLYIASNTIGDLNPPGMEKWTNETYFTDDNKPINDGLAKNHKIVSKIMVIKIWVFYWIAIYIMGVMLMNFVIAMMGNVYT